RSRLFGAVMRRVTVEGRGRPRNLPKNAAQGNRFMSPQVFYFHDFMRDRPGQIWRANKSRILRPGRHRMSPVRSCASDGGRADEPATRAERAELTAAECGGGGRLLPQRPSRLPRLLPRAVRAPWLRP